MRWIYILELSIRNLMSRKVRSILTIAGVTIGISAITFLVSLGYGLEQMITRQVADPRTLYIFEVNLEESDIFALTGEHLAKIKNLANVKNIEPAAILAGKASLQSVKTDVVINAFSNAYLDLVGIKLLRGTSFKNEKEPQAIVSTALLSLLNIPVNEFASKEITLEVVANKALSPFLQEGEVKKLEHIKIVGVVEDEQSAFVIMPFSLLQNELRLSNYNVLQVQVADKEKIGETRKQVEEMGFSTRYIGDAVSQINSFFVIFRVIIAGFGALAMIVAILGMLNTLTVSLLERTREVGVLKSNGATSRDIWRIFIADAIIISLIGGLIGIILGSVSGELINFVFNIYAHRFGAEIVDFFYTPLFYIFLALGLVLFVGLIVGFYPAKRATKINVLSALKYE